MPSAKQKIRKSVLQRQGLKEVGYGKLEADDKIPKDPRKTKVMRLLEEKHGKLIEELINPRLKLITIAKKLDLNHSTVSRWRKRLGMRD